MSEIMSYDRWMKYTYGGVTSIRSSELKAIDAALSRYQGAKTPANLNALQKAIVGWIQKKGPGWKSSDRNKYHAVDDLYKQSMGLPTPPRTGAEMVGFSHVRAESRVIVDDLFRNKTLDWKPGFFAKLANNKFGLMTNTFMGAKNADALANSGAAQKMAQKVFNTIVPGDAAGEVMGGLARVMPDFMKEFAASMVPFIGVAATGASAVYNGVQTLVSQDRLDKSRTHQSLSLSKEEPAVAINAVVRMLERERNYNGFSASVSTAAFAGKLSGVLADGGTATNAAIGLAANVAKLTNIVRVIVRDVLEKREGNRRMRMLHVDGTIFDVCPVIGAYMILCVPTSVMVNTVFDRVGEHGWRGDVELTASKHIVPLQNEARRLVQENRFEIPSLKNFPGMLNRNQKKLQEMEERKGKTGMEGFGSDNMPASLRT